MPRAARRRFCGGLLALGAGIAFVPPLRAAAPATPEQRLGRLLAGIERAEAVRAAKTLQNSFAQYLHHGLWDEAGRLFAADGLIEWDGAIRVGPDAIASHLRGTIDGGRDGLPAGAVHTQLLMTPVVTLSPSGKQARGRWYEVRMASGPVAWAASLLTADYARDGDRWKIARLVNHPIFAGSYAAGWRNVSDDVPVVPYAYTPESAGRPECDSDGEPQPLSRLAEAWRRIDALAAEDAVRNLQNAYGYYVDRKMWDDVADLFAADGALTIEGVGRFEGKDRIRRALEREGPAGLRHGELNDHPQLNMVVTVAPSGREARARGLDLGMIGHNGGDAFWTLATFDNRFVWRDGAWMIAEMRLYPERKADYYKGWPPQAVAVRRIAAFPPNPAAGEAVRYPAGLEPVANPMETAPASPAGGDVAEAERALARAAAFDAIENISSAIGNYLNDWQWYALSRLFTKDGWRKSPSAGYYRGRDRIWRMQVARNGPLRLPRRFLPMHSRIQPVIHISVDGRTAKLRTRLLQFNTARDGEGSMSAGMYEDRLAIEDGLWKFTLDDINHIWRSPTYSKGWARVPEGSGESLSRSPAKLIEAMPPDRPIEGPAFPSFPDIGRMWFHYRNPVSGRAPPDLLPD